MDIPPIGRFILVVPDEQPDLRAAVVALGAMVKLDVPSATPPKHSISAQRAAARLGDYERELAKTLLPREDPVEAFYKSVDPQGHSYNPRPPAKPGMPANSQLTGSAKLRMPRMLQRSDQVYTHSEFDVGAQVGLCHHTRGPHRLSPLSLLPHS